MSKNIISEKETIETVMVEALGNVKFFGLDNTKGFKLEEYLNEYLEKNSEKKYQKIMSILGEGNAAAHEFLKKLPQDTPQFLQSKTPSVPKSGQNAGKPFESEASTATENEVKTSNIGTQTTSTKIRFGQEIQLIPVDQILLDPEVSNIFPIEEENLEHVKNSIKEQGFLISDPIKVREKDGKYFIEDGHTRVRAAMECGIKKVFAVVKEFTNQNEFVEDAITAQTGRRNVRPSGLFKAIEKLSVIEGARAKARQHKGGLASEEAKGSANSIISTKLGISKSMVERIKKLQRDAKQGLLEEIFSEDITITAAYNQLIASEKQANNISSAESVQSQSVDEVEDVIEPNSDSETISNIESGLESSESKNIPDSESGGNSEVKSDSDKKESGNVQWSEEEAIALIKDLIAELKTHPNYKKLQRKYTKSYPAFTNLLK